MELLNNLISIKILPENIDAFINEIRLDTKFENQRPTNEYEIVRGKLNNHLIIVYSSGKIVVPNNPEILDNINEILETITPFDDKIIIGSDEVGKGEWLGPLVIGSVALDRKLELFLQSRGVMDSKKLSLSRIRELSDLIKEKAIAFGMVQIHPETFNKRYLEIKAEGKSLNDLMAWAHAKAIKITLEKMSTKDRNRVRKIVVDEFSKVITEMRIYRVINETFFNLFQKPHAEDVISVAAASIIAKNAREEWIDITSRNLSIDLRRLAVQELKELKDPGKIGKIAYNY